MIALKRILLPTDFSEPSEIAGKYAKGFADSFGASLHVLHVLDESYLTWAGNEAFAAPVAAEVRNEAEKAATEQLQYVLTQAEQQKYQARAVLRIGSPFVEIIRYAREENIDLIVMGTHGRGLIAHLLLGSVAERVVRKAPCPVLTVRHPEHEFVLP